MLIKEIESMGGAVPDTVDRSKWLYSEFGIIFLGIAKIGNAKIGIAKIGIAKIGIVKIGIVILGISKIRIKCY